MKQKQIDKWRRILRTALERDDIFPTINSKKTKPSRTSKDRPYNARMVEVELSLSSLYKVSLSSNTKAGLSKEDVARLTLQVPVKNSLKLNSAYKEESARENWSGHNSRELPSDAC